MTGRWAADVVLSDDLAAPHLMPVETANILRRAVHSSEVSSDVASLAPADLRREPVDRHAEER